MNNLLLGGQECTDYVDVEQNSDEIGYDRIAIIPRLNFTCNGRITSIRARVRFRTDRSANAFFQVWRPSSMGSTIYNKIGEVQLSDELTDLSSDGVQTTNIILTGINTIQVQSGDVVGYYRENGARYRFRTIQTDGYIQYEFDGTNDPTSVNLNNADRNNDNRQPLIQFTFGKCILNYWY